MRVIISFFLIFTSFFIEAQNKGLKLNIEDDSAFDGYEIYDSILPYYTVFMFGENHQFTKSNAELEFKTLQYLNQKIGVKKVLLELGWARGIVLTQYIQTGDSSLLPAIEGYSWKYYADMAKKIKLLNDSLSPENKIEIIGIDVERFYNMAVKVLALNLPKENEKKPNDSIALHIQSIRALNHYLETSSKWDEEKETYVYDNFQGPNIYKSIKLILENYYNNTSHYQYYIDINNQKSFFYAMDQLKDMETYEQYDKSNSVQGYLYRENYMYKRFKEEFAKDTTQKFLMQFGRCHSVKIFQDEACTWPYFYSIASKINSDDHQNLKGKVLSTAIYYPSSDSWSKENLVIKDHLEKEFFPNTNSESLHVWNIQADSILKQKHDFLIINTKSLENQIDPKVQSKTNDSEYLPNPFFLHFGFGTYNLSQKSYYDSYKKNGFEGVRSVIAYQISTEYQNQKSRLVIGFDLERMKSDDFKNDQDSAIKFTFKMNKIKLGWDIIPSKKLRLVPSLGVSYSNLTIKTWMDNHKINFTQQTIGQFNPFTSLAFGYVKKGTYLGLSGSYYYRGWNENKLFEGWSAFFQIGGYF